MWLNFHVKGNVLKWHYANRAAKTQAALDMLAERREQERLLEAVSEAERVVHPRPNVSASEVARRKALLAEVGKAEDVHTHCAVNELN